MFAPRSMVDLLAVGPEGPAGLNTIRGFLGGLFVGSSIVLAAGLATGNATFFLAVATVMSAVVVGRLMGIAVDGFDPGATRRRAKRDLRAPQVRDYARPSD